MAYQDYRVIVGRIDFDDYTNNNHSYGLFDPHNPLGVQVRSLLAEGWYVFGKPQTIGRDSASQVMIKRDQPVIDWDAVPTTINGTQLPSLRETLIKHCLREHDNDLLRADRAVSDYLQAATRKPSEKP